ncbi:hypothetical protein [Bacillus massilinigeriensis]|nr:hypothetical protein [Bacillus massilionigeriensis]
MPRGKELEQLPMANVAPSIGDNQSKYNRVKLNGVIQEEQPKPSQTKSKR